MLQEVTSVQDFEQILQNNPKTVMEFFAPWCPHCQHFFPVVQEFAQQQEGKVAVAQVSVDSFPQLFDDYGVESFPTLIYFQNGQPVAKTVGDQSLQDVDQFLAQAEAQAE